MNRPLRPLLVLTLLAAGLAGLPAHAQITPLPSVPEPAENPLTAEKAVLGKILFWDQQLSTGQHRRLRHLSFPGRRGNGSGSGGPP